MYGALATVIRFLFVPPAGTGHQKSFRHVQSQDERLNVIINVCHVLLKCAKSYLLTFIPHSFKTSERSLFQLKKWTHITALSQPYEH